MQNFVGSADIPGKKMRSLLIIAASGVLAMATAFTATEVLFQPDWSRYIIRVDRELETPERELGKSQSIRASAHEAVLLGASRPLEAFPVDNTRLLRDILAVNPTFAGEYSIFLQNLPLNRARFSGKTYYAGIDIPLRGTKGLLAILPLPWERNQYAALSDEEYISEAYESNRLRSEYRNSPAPEQYTGLIVDMRGIEFRPALAPRIFSEDGRLIYGPEFLSRRAGIERGIAGYARSLSDTELKARTGKRPLHIVALESMGHYRTDAVIAEEDAMKIFDHPTTLKNLRKAKVVFLIP